MNCVNCSAPLGAADLQNPNCRYCGALHTHIARAAEKVEVVKQLLAPGPGGMPVAIGAMMGQYGAAPPGQYGAPGQPGVQVVHQQVMMVNGVPVHTGQAPPMTGGPVGGGMPVQPPMFGYQTPQMYTDQAMRAVNHSMKLGLWITVGVFVMMFVMGMFAFFAMRF